MRALREDSPPIRVPLVDSYRHLGVLQTPKGSLTAEIRFRAAQAWAKFSEGRQKIHKAKGISIRRKAFLLRSSVLPKLLYGAGTWPCLRLHEQRALGGTLWSLYRAICGIPATDDQHMQACNILAITGLPSVQVTLHYQRLLYLKLLLKSGPDELWALVRQDVGYLETLREALKWLYSWTHATSTLPDPCVHWEKWATFIRDTPGRFKGLIHRAQALESCRQQVLGALDGLYRALRTLAPRTANTETPPNGCREACIQCQRLFATRVAWAGRAARVHGYRCKARILARSRLCLGCGKQYASVGRLRRHLITAATCVQRWGAFTPMHPYKEDAGVAHAQTPPVLVPGFFQDARGPDLSVPPEVSSGLFDALSVLEECDESLVWETVSDYIEPLQTLRDTVQFWKDGASESVRIQQTAENILLLLDPELIGEPGTVQQGKVCRHVFALGHPPTWHPLPSFSLPADSVGPSLDLAPPPPRHP